MSWVCAIFGHDEKVISTSQTYDWLARRFWNVERHCERCGETWTRRERVVEG